MKNENNLWKERFMFLLCRVDRIERKGGVVNESKGREAVAVGCALEMSNLEVWREREKERN